VKAKIVRDQFSPFPSCKRFLLVPLCGGEKATSPSQSGGDIILIIVLVHENSDQSIKS
jgi:hypothetical protein